MGLCCVARAAAAFLWPWGWKPCTKDRGKQEDQLSLGPSRALGNFSDTSKRSASDLRYPRQPSDANSSTQSSTHTDSHSPTAPFPSYPHHYQVLRCTLFVSSYFLWRHNWHTAIHVYNRARRANAPMIQTWFMYNMIQYLHMLWHDHHNNSGQRPSLCRAMEFCSLWWELLRSALLATFKM